MRPDQRLQLLLAKGYFPRVLPPVFTTMNFGTHSPEILKEWLQSKLVKPKQDKLANSYNYPSLPNCDPEVISTPKKNFERRNFHITHPIPQLVLTSEITSNWMTIHKWLSRRKFSDDRLELNNSANRGITDLNFGLHRKKVELIEATSDWLTTTDITRFFPSIYTHSIPWAAYGKERVKAKLSSYNGSLADRLDLLVRKCNRNQTIGIPVGPDTSRILAEIVSSRIDDDLNTISENISYQNCDRLQDDWVIGANSLHDAEQNLSELILAYRAYGLDINGQKTSINHLKDSGKDMGISELMSVLNSLKTLSGRNLQTFMDMSLKIQNKHRNDAVVSYTLSVLEDMHFSKPDTELLESYLLKAAIIAPGSLSKICRIIINQNYLTKYISKKRITDRFLGLAEKHIVNGNVYEAIWCLYTIRGLKTSIASKIIAERLEDAQGAALPLLLMDMKHSGAFCGKLPIGTWQSLVDKSDPKQSWVWLLAYEGIRHGWLSDSNRLMAQKFFKPLIARNIVFYDQSRNVKKSSAVKSQKLAGGKEKLAAARKALLLMRSTESEHY